MAAETAAEVSTRLSELVGEALRKGGRPLTAGVVRDVIARGEEVLDRIAANLGADPSLAADLARARGVFEHARERLEGLPDSETIPPSRVDLWDDPISPLMAGLCYGPPYCTAELAPGESLPIAPWGAQPWVLAAANAAWHQAADDAWAGLVGDLERRARAVGSGLVELGKFVAIAAGIYFLTKE